MAGFVIYKRISEEELRKDVTSLAPQIAEWFEQNPKRRICRADLWYGRQYSIKKKDIEGQLNKIVEEILKD